MQQKNLDTQMSLYRAHLLLEEGQHDQALQQLLHLQSQFEQSKDIDKGHRDDLAYLFSWCYIQRKQWDNAANALIPLYDASQDTSRPEPQVERERLAIYLLRLGEAATRLAHYEDASQHFSLCLKVLHNRRIHLPLVRIKACYSLATTCAQRGLYAAAIQHYEEALRLCKHYDEKSELPAIYYGLCETRTHTGDLDKAYEAGELALHLYEQALDRQMTATTHNLLGRVSYLSGNYRLASDQYTASLAIASGYNAPTMAMVNCAALADVRLAEDRLDEARKYADLALEYMKNSDNAHMKGQAYHTIGKVRVIDAQHSEGQKRQKLLEDAVKLFKLAEEQLQQTQAYPDIADVYGDLAHALEELGREHDALEIWHHAYNAMSQAQPSR